MENMKKWSIHEIEALTEQQAKEMALETLTVKGHTIYLVDLGEYFGYSCLVFCNWHHIHYANDYELHHNKAAKKRRELRDLYIEKLNSILFTDDEIGQPLENYDEFKRKENYLRNYYHMREDYVSQFRVLKNDEDEKRFKKEIENMYYDRLSFCYFPPDKADFIRHHYDLYVSLCKRRDEMNGNFEYLKDAFLTEMFNHEYGYNWEADFDVLSAFGNLEYPGEANETLKGYFDQLGFSDVQRSAYYAARTEYFNLSDF